MGLGGVDLIDDHPHPGVDRPFGEPGIDVTHDGERKFQRLRSRIGAAPDAAKRFSRR